MVIESILGIKYLVISRIVLLTLRRNKIIAVCMCATLFVVSLSFHQTVRLSDNNKCRIFPSSHGGSRANYSFPNVDWFIEQYQNRSDLRGTFFEVDNVQSYHNFLTKINTIKKKGKKLSSSNSLNGTQPFEIFMKNVNQNYLYHPDDLIIWKVLRDLRTRPITKVEMNPGSSHLVLRMSLDNGGMAIFKVQRTPKDQEVHPDLFFIREMERPNAEVAAFYLDRLLGFYRAPPIVSRSLNITRDIVPFGDKRTIVDTVHRSPAGNVCFFGTCLDYCSLHTPVCGKPDLIEGAVSMYLTGASIETIQTPWGRYIPPFWKTRWEKDDTFCDTDVKTNSNYSMRTLLNYMDVSVMDFLTGNLDRHHTEVFKEFKQETFFIHFDNGRGFGKSKYDCWSCMAPVRQCCLIRLSTLAKLLKLYIGPDSLSQVLRESLKADPSFPVLWEPHLDALDRRLGKLLSAISDCINVKGKAWQDVVIDDGLN
ncbi:Extracellular serine/threonine protein kinase fam20c [Biomphalaria glabrata]|uniref:Extracellular serine/threonine protein kinase FAM20C-like isoform X2 n=1 Tax=Biomphalaria glabrata TaxID=6526 RepID=A0A9W2ZNP2_BIOGL|nr:extracellular serine/threonine protein kinase FAM20C-like isoform X2 [Biomphalaria glabrata]